MFISFEKNNDFLFVVYWLVDDIPGPGSYDPKMPESERGKITITTIDRFTEKKGLCFPKRKERKE